MEVAEINKRTGQVVDAAMRVHTALGPGLLEGAYHACLAHELRKRGLRVRSQVQVPIVYDGIEIALGFRADLLVEDVILIELKGVPKLLRVHHAQLLTYLKSSGYRAGLLVNFHAEHLKDGLKRINGL